MSEKIERPTALILVAQAVSALMDNKPQEVADYLGKIKDAIAELEAENEDLNTRMDAIAQERCNATTEKLSELTGNLKAVSEQLSTPRAITAEDVRKRSGRSAIQMFGNPEQVRKARRRDERPYC